MQISRKAIQAIVLLAILSGCGNRTQKVETNRVEDTILSQKPDVDTTECKEMDSSETGSFVISCGSGCAMNYSSESITQLDSVIKVIFKVEMYVNEQLTDEYDEICMFYYTPSGKVDRIEREGENLLESLMPDAKENFLDFGNKLKKELKR